MAFDRKEHTLGISAASIALRPPLGDPVAISIPAPTISFTTHEAPLVAALQATAARVNISRPYNGHAG